MGIFSSKKKTIVGTSVSRVIPDKALPNSAITTTLQSILGGVDIVENQLESALSNIAMMAEKAYYFGKTSYPFGIPTGGFQTNTVGADELQETLNTLEGAPVLMEYHVLGPPNTLHIGWLKLIRDHGYDPATNIISSLTTAKGVGVYLHDIEVVLPLATRADYSFGVFAQYGKPATAGPSPSRPISMMFPQLSGVAYPSPVDTSTVSLEDFARVTYAWVTSSTDALGKVTNTLLKDTLSIYNSEYSENGNFFQVKYSVGGVSKYWIYQVGTGTYPLLDTVATQVNSAGEYYPLLHFRNNLESFGSNTATPEYAALTRMGKLLGMDYATTLAAIHENPDVVNVVQAYLTFAVPADTTTPIEQKYLYDFFDQQYSASQAAALPATNPSNVFQRVVYELARQHTLEFNDPLVKTSLTTSGILKQRRTGTIGPIGSHSSSYEVTPLVGMEWLTVPRHVYRRQLTEGIYDEIQVLNLAMFYRVLEGYWTAGDENDNILLIPVDRSIIREYPLRERELLIARSMHMVFNARQIVKVKWYQQEWFSTVLKIAAIVILVVSLGEAYSAAEAAWTAAAAIEGATATAAFLAALQVFVIAVVDLAVTTAAIKLFVKAVGVDAAIVAALVAAAFGYNSISESGGMANALPSAKVLLNLASGLISVSAQQTQSAIQDIYKEMELLESAHKKEMDLILDAQKLLETSTTLQPLVLFGEKPEDYYRRTMYSGNIGTMSIEAVRYYVDTALRLPDISQTLGDTAREL